MFGCLRKNQVQTLKWTNTDYLLETYGKEGANFPPTPSTKQSASLEPQTRVNLFMRTSMHNHFT